MEDEMRKLFFLGGLVLVLAISLVSFGQRVFAQTIPPTPAPQDQQGPQTGSAGQIGASSPNALTSFYLSNPYCYQPDPALDQCVINFRFIQATDNQITPPYMTWLAIKIGGKTRFDATAFFEGAITYSYDMNPAGFKVACGAPNAGGAGATFGNVYSVMVTPQDSGRNVMSTDIANVTCPAFAP
jgi:hypothetical protein